MVKCHVRESLFVLSLWSGPFPRPVFFVKWREHEKSVDGQRGKQRRKKKKGIREQEPPLIAGSPGRLVRTDISWLVRTVVERLTVIWEVMLSFSFLCPTQTWWKIHYFLFFVKFNIFLILHLEFRRSRFILSAYTYVTMRYVLNRFFPSFMEYLTPWLIDLARLPTRNVIWELETATQLTLWYPTYISTGDLCLNTNSLPFFRRRKVGFEVPALQEDN